MGRNETGDGTNSNVWMCIIAKVWQPAWLNAGRAPRAPDAVVLSLDRPFKGSISECKVVDCIYSSGTEHC